MNTGPFIRFAMTAVHRARVMVWFLTRPRTFGVRAIAVTMAGKVVLVRHSYVRGWHLPGGGQDRGEDAEAAVLRELREEIGMTAHGEVIERTRFFHRPNFKRDTVTLFVVRDVAYTPRLSLEIEAIQAFPPDALPDDVSRSTRAQIEGWLEGHEPGTEQ